MNESVPALAIVLPTKEVTYYRPLVNVTWPSKIKNKCDYQISHSNFLKLKMPHQVCVPKTMIKSENHNPFCFEQIILFTSQCYGKEIIAIKIFFFLLSN